MHCVLECSCNNASRKFEMSFIIVILKIGDSTETRYRKDYQPNYDFKEITQIKEFENSGMSYNLYYVK